MAKISQLPLLTDPAGTEAVIVLDGDTTRRARIDKIAAAAAAPAVAQAKAHADRAALAITATALQGQAQVIANTAQGTDYKVTVPIAFDALAPGALVDFLVPVTSLGPVRLMIGDGPWWDVFMVIGQKLRADWTVRVAKNVGGNKWNLVQQFPQGSDLADVSDAATAGVAAADAMYGVPIARPIDGNPNELLVSISTPAANFTKFDVFILATNTAPAFLTFADGRRFAVSTGGGAIAPGALVKGQITGLTLSLGGGTVNDRGSRPPAPDIWSVLDRTLINPYGDVVQGSDGKPVFTPHAIRLLGRGSSVSTDPASGRQGAAPAGAAPVQVLADDMASQFGSGIAVRADNWSHGGHVASQAEGQWAEAIAAYAAPVDILLDCFGMNDMAPAAYNSGQQSPLYLASPIYYEAELRRRLDDGVKLIVECTSPHPHTGRLTNSFGGNPMRWPYEKAAPVQAEELVPPFSRAVTPPRDWTGSGILRRGDARGGHVNLLIRHAVRRLQRDPRYRGRIVLLDVEWAWYRYGVEVYDLDQLYDPGEIVHPNRLGHQVSYQRCIREFVAAMRRGLGDQWCFRGEGVI